MDRESLTANVIVIGGGVAGMTAALTLAEKAKAAGQSLSILLLEGDSALGGRTRSVIHENLALSSGAGWFHGGNDNPLLKWLEARHGSLPGSLDTADNMVFFRDRAPFDRRTDETVELLEVAYKRFKTLYPADDISLEDLSALTETPCLPEALQGIAINWMAVDGPADVSADEFFSDHGATPGGRLPKGGMGVVAALMKKDLEAAGVSIVTDCIVKNVRQTATGVEIAARNGNTYHSDRAVVTLPLGVLKKGSVAFDPPLSSDVTRYIDGITIARFAKIFVPMKEAFFQERNIAPNTFVILGNFEPQAFCHTYTGGVPAITIMTGGKGAEEIEKMSPAEVEKFVGRFLSQAPVFDGHSDYRCGAPYVTEWNSNPLYLGTYSAVKVGCQRQGPIEDGKLIFCGEAFATAAEDAACMVGAWYSGLNAANKIYPALRPAAQNNVPPPNTGIKP